MNAFGTLVQPGLGGAEQMPEERDNGRRRFVSAQDVAQRAGVSRSAVSRAFTPGASIAPATLARVQAAADALGYEVNDLARGLLAHRSQLVGLVTSDADTPFRAGMIAALSRALIERGNVPAIISIGPAAEDVANASRQLLRYRAEATVFLSGSPPASLVELTRRNGQTLILINRGETELDSVRCDDRGGARQAFEALRATGASRFGVINMENPSPSLLARERAFADSAAASGATPTIVRAGHSDYEGGQEAARRLLANGRRARGGLLRQRSHGLRGARSPARRRPQRARRRLGHRLRRRADGGMGPYRLTTLRQDPERIAKEVVSILDRRTPSPICRRFSVLFSASTSSFARHLVSATR